MSTVHLSITIGSFLSGEADGLVPVLILAALAVLLVVLALAPRPRPWR